MKSRAALTRRRSTPVHGGYGHAAGRTVQRVHDESLAPGSRTVRQGHPDPHPAGPAGDALERSALPGTGVADAGECLASQIGTTRVATGAGSHPFEIEGNVYLTGPYEGAPFGLSIVAHVVAGPFNLGVKVVRRGSTWTPRPRRRRSRPTKPVRTRSRRSCSASRAAAAGHGRHRPAELHVQPDQLRGAADHAAISGAQGAGERLEPVRRRRLQEPCVQTGVRGRHQRRTSRPTARASTRSSPIRRARRQRREHRQGQGRCPSGCPRD